MVYPTRLTCHLGNLVLVWISSTLSRAEVLACRYMPTAGDGAFLWLWYEECQAVAEHAPSRLSSLLRATRSWTFRSSGESTWVQVCGRSPNFPSLPQDRYSVVNATKMWVETIQFLASTSSRRWHCCDTKPSKSLHTLMKPGVVRVTGTLCLAHRVFWRSHALFYAHACIISCVPSCIIRCVLHDWAVLRRSAQVDSI